MTVDIATLAIRIDSSEARTATRELGNLQQAGDRAQRSVGALEEISRKVNAALTFAGVGVGVASIIKMADEYTKLTAQLRLATQGQREYAAAYADVKRIANDAQQDLAATAVLYARIANGTRELGTTQKQVAAITETVNLGLKVSGATAMESAAAQLQLSQGFAAGALRGQEFNAVNEAAPRLMKALADGMGVPVGALRSMAEEGKITSQVMADVLPKALAELREEAKQVQTIGGAFTVLKNNVMEFVGVQAQASGFVSLLTGGIGLLANNLTMLMGVIATVGAAKLGTMFAQWATGAYANVTANRALLASNLAAAEANVIATAASSSTAAARVNELRATVLATEGAVALAIAQNGLIPAQARATIAAQAHAAALTAQTAAASAASVSTGVMRGALALLGGPVGAVITVLGLAATAWSIFGTSSEKGNKQATEATRASTDEIVAQMQKQIDAMNEKNRIAAMGVPTTKTETPASARLAEVIKEIERVGKAEGEYANLALDARQDILKKLGGQYGELTVVIEKFNKASADGVGNTTAAKALIEIRERLSGVNKQYLEDLTALETARARGAVGEQEYINLVSQLATETYKRSAAGKEVVSVTNKEVEAYESLISSIRAATAENRLELVAGENATASQKARVKLDQELASGKLVLSAAHQAVARAALDEQAATEQKLKMQQAEKGVLDFVIQSTQARRASQQALEVEYETYEKGSDARDIAMVAVRNEAEAQKLLDGMRKAGLPVTDEMISQLKLETQVRTQVEQATMAQTRALNYANQLKTENRRTGAESLADPRARAQALLEIDADVWRQRIEMAGQGTAAQKILQEQYNIWYADQSRKVVLDVDVARAAQVLQIFEGLDSAARSAAEGMEASFGRVGSAIGGLTTALTGYARNQAAIAAQLAATIKNSGGDRTKIEKANAVAAAASTQAQIKSYGDMASAAKGFFNENSSGYRTMEAVEKAFRASEMAMAMQAMVKKIFFKEGEVAANVSLNAAKVAGEASASAASTGLAATEASAWGITAVVKALASLPFPFNLAAGAATLAAVIAVGAKMVGSLGGGGGGGISAADAQKAQGTGSVFGDVGVKNHSTGLMEYAVKSDSVRRSIELLTDNSNSMLPINRGMLDALRNIETAMTGLTNLVVRTPGLTNGENMGIATGQINVKGSATDGVSNFMTHLSKGLLGPVIGGKLAAIGNNLWGKVKQEIVDSGLQYSGSVRDLQAGSGFDQYATVNTTKSSWFGLSKKTSSRIETQGLNDELSAQFGLIFTSLDKSLQEASVALGGTVDDVTKVLDGLTLESTKVSLKGLTGAELTNALNSVISKSMDEIAEAVFPQLDKFRKVGEGYAETVMRIAADYAKLDSMLTGLGTTFGATGMASIAARERLIELAGGIDELAEQTSYFAENFLTEAQRMAPMQKYVEDMLKSLGYTQVKTTDQYRDAVLGLANSGALLTEEGAKTYAALMALAPAFKEVADYAAQAANELADINKGYQDQIDDILKQSMSAAEIRALETKGMDASTIALYDRLHALQSEKSAMEAVKAASQDAFNVLSEAISRERAAVTQRYSGMIDSLTNSINSYGAAIERTKAIVNQAREAAKNIVLPGQESAARAAAQQSLGDMAKLAMMGVVPSQEALSSAIAKATQFNPDDYTSMVDMQRAMLAARNDINTIGDSAEKQISAQERAIEVISGWRAEYQSQQANELGKLDKQLESAQAQLNALNGINNSVMSVADAVKGFSAAINAAKAVTGGGGVGGGSSSGGGGGSGGSAPSTGSDGWYQNSTGWHSTGVGPGGSVVDNFMTSWWEHSDQDYWYNYRKENQTGEFAPKFANGGMHDGGWRIVGENGPELEATGPARIFTASQTAGLLRGGDNSAIVAELSELRKEVAKLREANSRENYAIAKNTLNTADHLDGAVNGEVPFAVVSVS